MGRVVLVNLCGWAFLHWCSYIVEQIRRKRIKARRGGDVKRSIRIVLSRSITDEIQREIRECAVREGCVETREPGIVDLLVDWFIILLAPALSRPAHWLGWTVDTLQFLSYAPRAAVWLAGALELPLP